MSSAGKIFKRLCIFLLSIVLLVAGASALVVALGITLDLNALRPAVEKAASAALERRVSITGPVTLCPSLWPTLEIVDVKVANPSGWTDPLFASVALVRLQVGIIPLLSGEIDVGEIICKGVSLNLESDRQGRNNWDFGASVPESHGEVSEAHADSHEIYLQAVDTLTFQDIRLSYLDKVLGKKLFFAIDELNGTAGRGEPLNLDWQGRIQDKQYSFTIKGGPLREFRPSIRLYPLSIKGIVAGSPFTASGVLGRERGEARFDLDMTLSSVDIGALLRWLMVAEDMDATTDEFILHLKLRGDSLNELVTRSNMLFTLKGGQYTFKGAGKGDGISVGIKQGEFSVVPGRPVALDLDGKIGKVPVTIWVKGMELVNYFKNPKHLPISIKMETSGTVVDFAGSLALPVSSRNISLGLKLKGEKLNSLDELMGVSLPPLGPYSLKADFAMDEQTYDLSDLEIRLGESRLQGAMKVDMAGNKPHAEVRLISSLLQLDDFDTHGWSLEGETVSGEEQESSMADKAGKHDIDRTEQAALLSREILRSFDARLMIELQKVMSGRDMLGSGNLEAGLQDGLLRIEPLQLKFADGSANMEFFYHPTDTAVDIHLALNVSRLDVGIIARRFKPDTRMGGRLSLDILLDAVTPRLNELMANGAGHFDLDFEPRNFNAGLVDLWAVNLLSALSKKVDKGNSSVINCVVASFGMKHGVMNDRVMFMDTTRMSVEGTAMINFRDHTLDIKAVPSAKKPEFFSLATPVTVKGTFDNFGVKIDTLSLAGTAVSFVTSPIHVPLRRIFSGKRPPDGIEACRQAWEKRNQ